MTDSSRRWLASGSWTAAPTSQIVFIDGSVPQAQELARDVGPDVVAVVLNADQDGVRQIAEWLTTHHVQDTAAIDVVAHGADGEIQLGNALLSAATIPQHLAQLAQIGNALQPGGAIQIYGCDVAQDAAGDAFLQQLSQATGGANIAASSHLVGSAADGGNWNLDVDVGTIEAGNPFTTAAITNFSSELSLSSDQLFFNASNGLDSSPDDSGNRVEQISVNGTNAASNPINLADGSSDGNALDFLRGVAVDAPKNEFFVVNGTPGPAYNYYGLYRGVTNPGGPNQSLTEIYTAPGATGNVVGVLNGVALDQPNGKVYFAQAGFDFVYGTFSPTNSGIFEVGVNGGAVTHVASTPDTLKPGKLALDVKDNLVFFTAYSVDPNNGSSETGVVVDAANLTTGSIQQLVSFSSTDMFPGGIAVNSANDTVYFTTNQPQNTSSTENAIVAGSFSVTGTGATAAVLGSHFSSTSTLYSGTHANVPEDIAIDPANGVFFITGQTAVSDGTSGQAAAILAGSLTNTNTAANLIQIFNVTSIEAVGSGNVGGPAFDDNAEGLALDSTPTVSASGTVTYAQGGVAVALDPSLTVSNQDGQNLLTAKVAIGSGFLTGDTLTAAIGGTNINASFSGGTLTLTGASTNGGDTLANFQSVLDSVRFSTTNANPTVSGTDDTRTISWTISDGIITSSTPTTTLDIHAAFITAGTTATFTGGGSPVALDGGVTAGDSVGTNFNSATISVGSFVTGDTLNFSAQHNITETSFNNGTLILGGSDTFTNYQTALQSITYSFTPGGDPTNGGGATTRNISWVVNDGTVVSPSASSTLDLVHAAPTIQTSGTVTYNKDGAPVALDNSIVIVAPDSSSNLAKATVAITGGYLSSSDTLTVGSNPGGLTVAFNSGTLTLSGTSSATNYQTALESVPFSNSSDPTNGNTDDSRTITWTVNDGVSNSSASTSNVNTTACYLRGTLIETPDGAVPIESMAIGDHVLTLFGEARPIKWIGRRSYAGRFAANRAVQPIRIRTGALETDVPRRDLYVSPLHALFIDDVLVPAEKLVNGVSILHCTRMETVEYFHIELESHDVLLAEGAPAESFADCDNRAMFHNGLEFAALYPADERATWSFCAPRVDTGDDLARIRWKLEQRFGWFEAETTADPALCLIADGTTIGPEARDGTFCRFHLARPPRELRIVSRVWDDEGERLGICLSRIVLSDDDSMVVIGHSNASLCDGFHAAEATHRWTDGDACVPARFLACFDGAMTVELELLDCALPYAKAA